MTAVTFQVLLIGCCPYFVYCKYALHVSNEHNLSCHYNSDIILENISRSAHCVQPGSSLETHLPPNIF
jgi:hypothetical protein